MEALQPSFMLLPDFAFLPEKDLRLGSVLPMVRATGRPNPRTPLTATFSVDADEISTQIFEPWKWDSENSLSNSGGVFADLSFLSGIGAGVEGSRSHTSGLSIECERVVRTIFRPTEASIAQVASDQTVAAILKKLSRPSVYIVTGLMVARGAKIEVTKGRSRSGGAHTSVDVTHTGVPINAGVDGGASKSENAVLAQAPTEDFVLAYQLLHLRKKLNRKLDAAEENRWALFNDDQDNEGETEFMEEIDVIQVTEDVQWGEDDDHE